MLKTGKFLLRLAGILVLGVALLVGWSAWQVYDYATRATSDYHADAALVLGAAAWGDKPSPVYRERIQHSIYLYQNQFVKKIIFTGGTPKQGYPTEAEVGKMFAIKHGVPPKDIIVENASRNTLYNIRNAKQLMQQHAIKQVILVSDPDHMARAMSIAQHFNVPAYASPTPTSRYVGSNQRSEFFWREVFYLSLFRVYQMGSKMGISFHFNA
ncbi:YdcF family protein [Alysiella filiformis]|uniref:Uncharacterized SAM-binding protein YcdF, DUF218 family n=1 Tax=Alysiella filiformis DSM 16848 TaxID=1120981 RepID=A0A286EF03_9NEIS|nr:YdcF family protein [Alysiella filiformis]QMT31736.1 YdcF family protein [Alysiella filiformis]UBQ55252.1 YdcF family protein [Alysiella filiformis DSM 16848]SOD69495.1 Uncharacterized SAM-binding protein YcdF, DUF218 family [Alysiella filiformis DSM 16848]